MIDNGDAAASVGGPAVGPARAGATDVAARPKICLEQLQEQADALLTENAAPLCGIGVGLLGAVEFDTGGAIATPIIPGRAGHPVRERLRERFPAPVRIHNEVTNMAPGELRAGLAKKEHHALFVKIGTGIGAGLISNGRLHRGAQAGAVGFGNFAVAGSGVACPCGNEGYLEGVAGGAALARNGPRAGKDGASREPTTTLDGTGTGRSADAAAGAQAGEPACRDRLVRAGNAIGGALADVVNFVNSSLIMIGGGVANVGDLLLAPGACCRCGWATAAPADQLDVVRPST